jgi:phosphorylcholine metabolism protein LicD
MSDDVEHYRDPQNAAVALYLQENDADELTDVLVTALNEAFRILAEDEAVSTIH